MRSLFIIPLLMAGMFAAAQTKTLLAVKTDKAPKIDGNLDDGAWQTAPVAGDFIQFFPTSGLKASVKTEVKVLYDNSAIYIGAYLFDDPSLIRKQITARDGEQQTDADHFAVFLDTYDDHQNGFEFLVTSMNVQTDARLGPNLGGNFGFGQYGDKTWDAVWQSETSIKDNGWVVEMKIPYLSLRFAKKDVQNWGLQFLRFTRRNNEQAFWNPVDPSSNGFVNQFGELKDLKNIQPPLRLSFSPYVSTGVRSVPQKGNYTTEWLHNGGMDVKYGLNESFTLDATLIPDFGQVVSDNIVNNLTPYEIKFQENRPFFTEGTELFNKAGLFYSRRVGAVPAGYYHVRDSVDNNPNLEIIKNPSVTQLYNAIKFSGRTKNKLGIGIFNALTAPMHAEIRNINLNERSKIETAPLTNYNLFVLDQALNGRSYITFTNANTLRNGNSRDANVSAFDFNLYDKRNVHSFAGTARYSKIWGLDKYDGFNTTLKFGKVSGNWQYNIWADAKSENYDPNDLGILFAPNLVTYFGNLTYRIFTPTKNFITYGYTLSGKMVYLFKPYAYSRTDLTGSAFLVFKNFWDVTVTSFVNPGWGHDYFELRTANRYLAYPSNYALLMNGSSDSRKKFYVRYGGQYAISPKYHNIYYSLSYGMRYRFSNNFSLDLQLDPSKEKNQLGYAFEREVNKDPIVGFRENRSFTSVLTGIYNFTSRLNLTLRARHYWNNIVYNKFFDVDNKGMLVPRNFINNKNQNINFFNMDAFLTWDFRLGSHLILGYKNWLGDDQAVSTQYTGYLKNFTHTFALRHANEVTVKFIYFLDYNQLRKK